MMNKRTIIGLAAVIAAVIGIVIYQVGFLHVRATSPKNNATDITPPAEIIVTFNKEMAPSASEASGQAGVNVIEFSPPTNFTATTADKTITIFPDGFERNIPYTMTLKNIRSRSGSRTGDFTLKFTIGSLTADEITGKAKFIDSLPYTTSDFSVDFNGLNNSFDIQVFEGPVETTKQAALHYLRENGIDTKHEKVSFYIIPTLSGGGGP